MTVWTGTLPEVIRRKWLGGFNTLALFKVPTENFVSQVADYAPVNRYSITGWFMEKQA